MLYFGQVVPEVSKAHLQHLLVQEENHNKCFTNSIYLLAQHYIPDDINLQQHCNQKLESHTGTSYPQLEINMVMIRKYIT
jgi:hypothetical protein